MFEFADPGSVTWVAARRTAGNRTLEHGHAVALATAVRSRRVDRGLSQEALAHAAGVSTLQVTRIENARGNPTLATLVGLADALEVSVAQLVQI